MRPHLLLSPLAEDHLPGMMKGIVLRGFRFCPNEFFHERTATKTECILDPGSLVFYGLGENHNIQTEASTLTLVVPPPFVIEKS